MNKAIKELSKNSVFYSEEAISNLYDKTHSVKTCRFYIELCYKCCIPLDIIEIHPTTIGMMGYIRDAENKFCFYNHLTETEVLFLDSGIVVTRNMVIQDEHVLWLHELMHYTIPFKIDTTQYKIQPTND